MSIDKSAKTFETSVSIEAYPIQWNGKQADGTLGLHAMQFSK